jgi:hypothetical protein
VTWRASAWGGAQRGDVGDVAKLATWQRGDVGNVVDTDVDERLLRSTLPLSERLKNARTLEKGKREGLPVAAVNTLVGLLPVLLVLSTRGH